MSQPLRTVSLADAVRYLRTKRQLSARSLSQTAGLSPSYVSKLEAGEIEPSVRAFGRIALVLGMSEWEVFFCVVTEGLNVPQDNCHTPMVLSPEPEPTEART